MNSTARLSCPFCPDIAFDPLGHHAVSCRHGGDVVIRHNRLRNIITDLCRCAHLSVRVEVGRGLLGSHTYARPAHVLVDGWDRAKPAAFDVTVTSPLTPVTLNETSSMKEQQPWLPKPESMQLMMLDAKHSDGHAFLLPWKLLAIGEESHNVYTQIWIPIYACTSSIHLVYALISMVYVKNPQVTIIHRAYSRSTQTTMNYATCPNLDNFDIMNSKINLNHSNVSSNVEHYGHMRRLPVEL